MSKSRPRYAPLQRDPAGRRHLAVLQTTAAEAVVEAVRVRDEGCVEVWVVQPELSVGGEATPKPPDGRPLIPRGFTSKGSMFEALGARLRGETMGLRLYAAGDEAFLWDVFGLASAVGLGREEVRLSRVGPPARRVYCTHCATMNNGVRDDLVACCGCGLILSVRDHFSRRLSAFMGVHADAEAPGELREPQALDP